MLGVCAFTLFIMRLIKMFNEKFLVHIYQHVAGASPKPCENTCMPILSSSSSIIMYVWMGVRVLCICERSERELGEDILQGGLAHSPCKVPQHFRFSSFCFGKYEVLSPYRTSKDRIL